MSSLSTHLDKQRQEDLVKDPLWSPMRVADMAFKQSGRHVGMAAASAAHAGLCEFPHDPDLTYLEVVSPDIADSVTVGFSYDPGDPGDPGAPEDLEVMEVWLRGVDIANVMTDEANEKIAEGVLVQVHQQQSAAKEAAAEARHER